MKEEEADEKLKPPAKANVESETGKEIWKKMREIYKELY